LSGPFSEFSIAFAESYVGSQPSKTTGTNGPWRPIPGKPTNLVKGKPVRNDCVVNSHNEWDTLKEVIVGDVTDANIPEYHISGAAVWPQSWQDEFKKNGGSPFAEWLREGAKKELDHFCTVLRDEGVIVRRPNVQKGDFDTSISTPDFTCPSQMYAAMPRDVQLIVGNDMIEAPMAWRSRSFEWRPYRALQKEYFLRGGDWTVAPKAQMGPESYNQEWESFNRSNPNEFRSVITEFEIMFDAPDFVRFGRDIFVQQSQVTNRMGIEWMRRHLGDDYAVHELRFGDAQAMHIDSTFVPLGPGKVLINPTRQCYTGERSHWFTYNGQQKEFKLPEWFKGWEIFIPPNPTCSIEGGPKDFLNNKELKIFFDKGKTFPCYTSSPWTATTNMLLLGEDRVICEASQVETINFMKEIGLKPIPVPFNHFLPFGGSFHCATTDIRREGTLESYF